MVLSDSTVPFERRGVEWDTGGLPVPGDVLVYTEQECLALRGRGRFSDVLAREVIWVLERQSQKISRMQDRPGESPVDPAAVETDPVIEAYKKDIDRTLLRANLARTVDERLQNLCRLQRFAEELKRARRTVG